MPGKLSCFNSDGFRTLVDPGKSEYPLSHRQGTLLMGSCFTENIGKYLENHKFRTDLNPFGIVYHPAVMGIQLRRILSGEPYSEGDLVLRDGLWHSFDHHGRFSGPDKAACLTAINKHLSEAGAFIRSAGHLILTFGTANAYHLVREERPVANCHKFPDADFSNRRYSPDEILTSLVPALGELREVNEGIRFVWTISPVRYVKEGPLGNQLSKSTLVRVIAGLLEEYSDSFYFPAYEIFMDDLRDYRFYDTDMIHPGPAGIAYTWERFRESCISEESAIILRHIDPLIKAAGHRQEGRSPEALIRFNKAQMEKIAVLQHEFPFLDFNREIRIFNPFSD